jgi:hypothetical protein
MPIPKPRANEQQGKFISRCVAFLVGEGRPQNQAAAICHEQWRGKEEETDCFKGLLIKEKEDGGA